MCLQKYGKFRKISIIIMDIGSDLYPYRLATSALCALRTSPIPEASVNFQTPIHLPDGESEQLQNGHRTLIHVMDQNPDENWHLLSYDEKRNGDDEANG